MSWQPVEWPIRTILLEGRKEVKYATHSASSLASFWRDEVPQPLYEEERRTSAMAQSFSRDAAMVEGYLL